MSWSSKNAVREEPRFSGPRFCFGFSINVDIVFALRIFLFRTAARGSLLAETKENFAFAGLVAKQVSTRKVRLYREAFDGIMSKSSFGHPGSGRD